MSMAKPDAVRDLFERQMEYYDKSRQDKIKRAIIEETNIVQHKIILLENQINVLEHYTRTLHEQKKWFKLKWSSFVLHRKQRKLAYLKQITPSKKSTEQLLG